jgi:thiosulfate dehydrogenase
MHSAYRLPYSRPLEILGFDIRMVKYFIPSIRVLASGFLLIAVTACGAEHRSNSAGAGAHSVAARTWPHPDPATLADGPHKQDVLYGEALIRRTYAIVGPNVVDPTRRYSGNNLACGSCHLDGGRQRYALSLIGVAGAYPRNMARENAVQTLAQRINGCFERSMNGRALPVDSREMTSIIAYIQFLSDAAPADVEGRGAPTARLLNRAADPARGAEGYASRCAVCHGADGQGARNHDGQGYLYPPLWGADSFNNGAGMHRIITAANFIRANMPFGTTYERPLLTEEQAFDIAAFINVQVRPQRSGLDRDYPNRSRKPVDAPFPPYADHFSQRQHTFGPWTDMVRAREGQAQR